jgi:hypothetical protein
MILFRLEPKSKLPSASFFFECRILPYYMKIELGTRERFTSLDTLISSVVNNYLL